MSTTTGAIGEHGAGKSILLPRPKTKTGWIGWLTTVDHKRIGILYGVTGLLFLALGGVEALIMRLQLAGPNQEVVSAGFFNQLVTMHGTTMIFLAVMPINAAFFNLLVPLMIGARDVAFPRLNAFSYWTFLAGAIFLNSSWFLGGAPDAGWFAYANLTAKQYNPGHGMDFFALGQFVMGIATLAAGLNFAVTIINMRAPGMSLMRMPVFIWMTLVVSILIILAFPAFTIALLELTMDRLFGTNFFNTTAGGLPLLWQHLFWIFGHPEVYILVLPAMGMVSDILPTFSRKPLFGYPLIVFSGIAIGFMGFAVWSHHMFTVGLNPVANAAFSLTTMAIAVPTGVKIFNWIGTLWGGKIRMTTPMLYAIGFIAMFMIGGFSGIMHAAASADAQQQDTYFIVAHFHYVAIGGILFALLAGFNYWFPKATGRMMRESRGKIIFWLAFIGFNVTFFPMHFLGLQGMPRRIYTYDASLGLNLWNFVATVGAFLLALAILLFVVELVRALFRGEPAGNDPWDGRTLEWSIPSPPPEYNFAVIPTVQSLDDFWDRKQSGRKEVRTQQGTHGIHMPGQSWFPLVVALGLFIGAYGLVYHLAVAVLGLLIVFAGTYGWAFEGVGGEIIYPEEGKK